MFESINIKPLGDPVSEGVGQIGEIIRAAREKRRLENQFRAKLLMEQGNIDADNRRADREMGLQEASFERTNRNQAEERQRQAVKDFQAIWEAAGKDPRLAMELAKAHGFTVDASNPQQPLAIPGRTDQKSPPAMAPDQRDPMEDIHVGDEPEPAGAPEPPSEAGEPPHVNLAPAAPTPPVAADASTADLEAQFRGDALPDPAAVAAVMAGKKQPHRRVYNLGDVGPIDVRDVQPPPAETPPEAPPGRSVLMMAPTTEGEAYYPSREPPAVKDTLRNAAFRIKGGPGSLPESTVDPEASRSAIEEQLARDIKLKSAGPEATALSAMLRQKAHEDFLAEQAARYRTTSDERQSAREYTAGEAMRRARVGADARLGSARILATGRATPTDDEDSPPPFGSKAGNQVLDAEGKLDNVVQKVLTNTGYKAEALQDRKFNQLSTVIAGAKNNAALAQAGAGAWVKQAQGGTGVLSDKDMNVFWDRIGGVPDRVENYIDQALSGKMGAERQRTVSEAVKTLAGTARAGMERIGGQIKSRLNNVAYAPPEVVDRYLETYVPGYAAPAPADTMHRPAAARSAAPPKQVAPAAGHPSADPVGATKVIDGQTFQKVGPNNWKPVAK